MNPEQLQQILSGEQRSLKAGLLRLALSFAEPFYTIGVTTIRFLYNMQLRPILKVSRPVISVGNITTGGTGKTPFTALLVQKLQERGRRPGIASRGYQALQEESADVAAENDEKRMLDQICPGTPHLQNRDRVRIARQLIRDHACDCVVLDDGFQHRRLARDLDIVLIDAVNPFGYGHLLPRGLLREPLTSLQRADLIVITRVDLISTQQLQEIRETLSYFTREPILEVRFEATGWLTAQGDRLPINDQPVSPLVFCGIGNPQGFRQKLAALQMTVTDEQWQVFPDHHHYTQNEIDELARQAQARGGELVTTQKDLVKLTGRLPTDVRCRALLIEAVIAQGEEELLSRLEEL